MWSAQQGGSHGSEFGWSSDDETATEDLDVKRRTMTQSRDGDSIQALLGTILTKQFAKLEHEAARSPLHPDQLKMAKIFVKNGFPGAQELLRKCRRAGVKKAKAFAKIVKETPRHENHAMRGYGASGMSVVSTLPTAPRS